LAVPLFHITALGVVFLWSIPSGTQLFMQRKWDAGAALKVIQKEGISRFTGVPTMVRDMLEHPEFSAEAVKTIKNMSAGGAPVPPSQVAKMHEKTGQASSSQGYGLTETHVVCFNKGVDYMKHPTSCGKPVPLFVQVKVQDPDTKQWVKDGERGELCIKSAMNMRCYNNRPEDTAKAIDKEGFFHSGDIAKIEGGMVYILDRLKDLIIRGGENIDCSEVEAALYSHPAVRECSVFGIPDERLGEVVGCAIYWQGDKAPTTAEISAHAASSLAKFKVPLAEHIFLHTEALPKGATGKLDKKGLRDTYKDANKGPPASKL
jgi:acyl-CoA synthetase (AMP-forming)/AMP-acid ligase II